MFRVDEIGTALSDFSSLCGKCPVEIYGTVPEAISLDIDPCPNQITVDLLMKNAENIPALASEVNVIDKGSVCYLWGPELIGEIVFEKVDLFWVDQLKVSFISNLSTLNLVGW